LSIEEQHIALPKLYGAPAYARPPKAAEETSRPFDPDDMPIVADQTDEERELFEALPERSYLSIGHGDDGERVSGDEQIRARPFRIRALAGRFRGGN
jgi:hypothetical protein